MVINVCDALLGAACKTLIWFSAGYLSAAAGLKAWVAEGRVEGGRFLQASSSFRGQLHPVQLPSSSLIPPSWTLHLLRNWKIHKWVCGERRFMLITSKHWGLWCFSPEQSGILGYCPVLGPEGVWSCMSWGSGRQDFVPVQLMGRWWLVVTDVRPFYLVEW